MTGLFMFAVIFNLFQECDPLQRVKCVDLDIFNADGKQESVCLQCPLGTAGDGKECRGMKYYCGKLRAC